MALQEQAPRIPADHSKQWVTATRMMNLNRRKNAGRQPGEPVQSIQSAKLSQVHYEIMGRNENARWGR
jgi:hypothetical protein